MPIPNKFTKIFQVPDLRIDFAAITAFIGSPQHRPLPVMPADPKESSPTPLAEISQGPSAFEQFLDKNQKNLVILSILIALCVAMWVVYSGIQKSRQETAGSILGTAQDTPSLQSLITEHTGTQAAASATVLLADRQWTEGQQDNAIETLKKFIAANPTHPALPTAMASLGAKLMIQGKTADASKVFEEIITKPEARFIAPYALISLGDIAKIGGDLEKAETTYSRVKMDFPESSFAETANRRIATLKTKAPVEIAPPPAPPAPPSSSPTPMPGGVVPSGSLEGNLPLSPTPTPMPGGVIPAETPPTTPTPPPAPKAPEPTPAPPAAPAPETPAPSAP